MLFPSNFYSIFVQDKAPVTKDDAEEEEDEKMRKTEVYYIMWWSNQRYILRIFLFRFTLFLIKATYEIELLWYCVHTLADICRHQNKKISNTFRWKVKKNEQKKRKNFGQEEKRRRKNSIWSRSIRTCQFVYPELGI